MAGSIPQTHCTACCWTDSKWNFCNMCIANKIWLAINACMKPQPTDSVGRYLKTVFDTADYEWPYIFQNKSHAGSICNSAMYWKGYSYGKTICIIPQTIWQLILFNLHLICRQSWPLPSPLLNIMSIFYCNFSCVSNSLHKHTNFFP